MSDEYTDEDLDADDAKFLLYYNEAVKFFDAHPVPRKRKSNSCGNCLFWEWGYEGEGTCEKFSVVTITIDDEDMNIDRTIDSIDSTDICDEFQMKEKL